MLVDRGLVESRSRAQALVIAGKVFSGERKLEKPGTQLPPETPLEVRGRDHPWVSRGGLKLVHALEAFDLSPQDAVCIDVGASTGGFTHVLLAQTVVAGGSQLLSAEVRFQRCKTNAFQKYRVTGACGMYFSCTQRPYDNTEGMRLSAGSKE